MFYTVTMIRHPFPRPSYQVLGLGFESPTVGAALGSDGQPTSTIGGLDDDVTLIAVERLGGHKLAIDFSDDKTVGTKNFSSHPTTAPG
jgi:hypothetical protein